MSNDNIIEAKISNKLSKGITILMLIYVAIIIALIITGFIIGNWESGFYVYSGWFTLIFKRKGTGVGSGADTDYYPGFIVLFILIMLILLSLPLIYFALSNRKRKLTELCLRDNEIVGSYTAFIPVAKIDLKMPIEKIDNVTTLTSFLFLFTGKVIMIYSASTAIKIPYVTNADEMVAAIMGSIKKIRETNNKSVQQSHELESTDYVESIKKLAELKEANLITAEEYDKKKNELLQKI